MVVWGFKVVYNGCKWGTVVNHLSLRGAKRRSNPLGCLTAMGLLRPFGARNDTLNMFIGEYQHNLDDKGRLAIPAKFRAELKKGAVVTRGLDSCLFLYTKSEWAKLAEKLAALPFSQSNSRAFARLMLAGAMEVDVDAQGRMVLPEYLRTFATLKKNVIVAGLYSRVEIWDEANWNKYKTQTESQSNEIAERMAELGV